MVVALSASVLLVGCGGVKPGQSPNTSQQPGSPKLPAGVVATYNDGKKVTQAEFDTRLHIYEYFYNKDLASNAQAKNQVLGDLMDRRLLYDEALARGFKADGNEVNSELDKLKADLAAQVYQTPAAAGKKLTDLGLTDQDLRDFVTVVLTVRPLITDLGNKAKPTPEELQKYYTDNKDAQFGEQARASHILVADEAKANDLEAKLKAGADFAQLAKDNSTDTVSAQNGGDLDFFSKGKMVPEFDKAVFSMKVGDISAPVKSQFGWHIIKVTDHKPARTFDEAKAEIEKAVTDQKGSDALQKLLTDLRTKANIQKITFQDASAAPAPPTPSTPSK